MGPAEDGKLLRIFVGEDDEHDGQPRYQATVQLLRREGMAGATVFRGMMGFGESGALRHAHVLRLSEGLPILIECVDRAARVEAVLPALGAIIGDGLVTIQQVEIRLDRGGGG